jgi:hypothetical protein
MRNGVKKKRKKNFCVGIARRHRAVNHITNEESNMTYKLAVLACIMLFANLAFAHGNEKHVIGTVTKVSQGSVTVETTANTTVEVTIISDTKFTKGDSSATPKDLLVGVRTYPAFMPCSATSQNWFPTCPSPTGVRLGFRVLRPFVSKNAYPGNGRPIASASLIGGLSRYF